MSDNFETLDIGQIEVMHNQVHERLESDGSDCDMLRSQHDSLAAELVKRGIAHNTEVICPESELAQKAPNYQRGFTDDVCINCAFGQLFPYCNLYKADYTKDFVCDSFRYYEILELEPPHGFLIAKGKQTAIADTKDLDCEGLKLIVSDGEVFGIAELDKAVQMKTKEFDTEEWTEQHRVIQRERRQWWPDSETFFVYRLKEWYPYEGTKLYEDDKVIDRPKLTAKQWQIVSRSKELPRQIILNSDAVSITDKSEFIVCSEADCQQLNDILTATYETEVKAAETAKEIIPIYSLALVRNPKMRVSKKNLIEGEKQEDDNMPFKIVEKDEEYCVINSETEKEMGCHETETEAEAQLTALRINVEAEEEKSSNEPEILDQPVSEVISQPVEHEKPEKVKKAGFIENLRSLSKSIVDFLKQAENEGKEVSFFVSDVGIGQKLVNGEVWHFTYSTNAFEDREGEFFSIKSLENYVTANEQNENKGYFNLWHINEEDGNFNTDFARKQWQAVIGGFLIEAGPYLEDKKGQAARKFFKQYGNGHPAIAPEGWGCSPEYRYLPEERETKVYQTVWITRTSTLPKFAAANIWTETRQLKAGSKMSLSKQQLETAKEIFKDVDNGTFVDALIKEAESKTTELEEAGIARKSNDKTEVTEQSEPQQIELNMEELATEMMKQFTANFSPMAEAMVTMADNLKEMESRLSKLEETKHVENKTETPRFIFNMQRASEQQETVVTDDDGLKQRKPQEAKTGNNDPWSQIFNK